MFGKKKKKNSLICLKFMQLVSREFLGLNSGNRELNNFQLRQTPAHLAQVQKNVILLGLCEARLSASCIPSKFMNSLYPITHSGKHFYGNTGVWAER